MAAQGRLHDRLLVQSITLDLIDDSALIEHQHAVGEVNEFGNLGRVEQHRAAGFRESAHQQIDFMLGADVDAPRRIIKKKCPALGEEPFSKGDLLLVAARKGAGACPQGALVDVDAAVRRRERQAVCELQSRTTRG